MHLWLKPTASSLVGLTMPKKTKARFTAGDWVSVPLRNGGRALGAIARRGRIVLLGYFFPWPHDDIKLEEYIDRLKPQDATLVATVGDTRLADGAWTVVHSTGEEGVARWPVPVFRARSALGETAMYTYADNDLLTEIPLASKVDAFVSNDPGLYGAIALEDALYYRLKELGVESR